MIFDGFFDSSCAVCDEDCGDPDIEGILEKYDCIDGFRVVEMHDRTGLMPTKLSAVRVYFHIYNDGHKYGNRQIVSTSCVNCARRSIEKSVDKLQHFVEVESNDD